VSEAQALPAFTDLVAALEAIGGPPPETRPEAAHDALVARFPEFGAVSVEDTSIDGPHGPVPARRYAPPTASGAVLLWLHGGGWINGNLDMPEAHRVGLSLATHGVTVLSADYRKALFGVRHPVPADDVVAAWQWMRAHLSGERYFIGGASAGAQLSAGVTMRLRDSGEATPEGVLLVYPAVHPQIPEYRDDVPAGTFLFTPPLIEEIVRNYVGDGEGLSVPHAWPALGDVRGFPPHYIVNAEHDSLRASGEAYAEQLHAAGVPVVNEMEPGTQHGYLDDAASNGATQTLERVAHWLTDPRFRYV
jgi:acetyl esterase/lipase